MTLQVEVATNLICNIQKHISSFTGISRYEFTGTKSLKAIVLWQGEAAALADKYGLTIGIPVSSAILAKKRLQYRYSHGIGE